MTGNRCSSIHVGDELTVIDPIRGENETDPVIVRSLSNEFLIFDYIVSSIAFIILLAIIKGQIFQNNNLEFGRNKIPITLFVNTMLSTSLDFINTALMIPLYQFIYSINDCLK